MDGQQTMDEKSNSRVTVTVLPTGGDICSSQLWQKIGKHTES